MSIWLEGTGVDVQKDSLENAVRKVRWEALGFCESRGERLALKSIIHFKSNCGNQNPISNKAKHT